MARIPTYLLATYCLLSFWPPPPGCLPGHTLARDFRRSTWISFARRVPVTIPVCLVGRTRALRFGSYFRTPSASILPHLPPHFPEISPRSLFICTSSVRSLALQLPLPALSHFACEAVPRRTPPAATRSAGTVFDGASELLTKLRPVAFWNPTLPSVTSVFRFGAWTAPLLAPGR